MYFNVGKKFEILKNNYNDKKIVLNMWDTSWKFFNIKTQRTIKNKNFQPDFEQSTKLFTLVVKNKKSIRSSPNNYPVYKKNIKIVRNVFGNNLQLYGFYKYFRTVKKNIW